MAQMDACSVDAIVTDPPYGLEFMGKEWDRPWAVSDKQKVGYAGREDNLTLPAHGDNRNANCRACGGRARGAKRCACSIPNWDRNPASDMAAVQTWHQAWAVEALRVLKPGGHLVAFGAPRTYHRLACAIEDAGFEIRDSLMWLFGSGFPKSLDVSKSLDKAAGAEREIVGTQHKLDAGFQRHAGNGRAQPEFYRTHDIALTAPATAEAERWQGWGTALKPAYEPIVLARKPLTGTVAANVLAYGTGGINVDGCRIEHDGRGGIWGDHGQNPANHKAQPGSDGTTMGDGWNSPGSHRHEAGRWPANVVLDEAAAELLDLQTGERPSTLSRLGAGGANPSDVVKPGLFGVGGGGYVYGDSGGPSRFFYTAKASRSEREAGLEDFERQRRSDGRAKDIENPRLRTTARRNDHPTVKPVALMRWLCRLVTPPGGLVLDPFMGSGSTRVAALAEGFDFLGIELDDHYAAIAAARLATGKML